MCSVRHRPIPSAPRSRAFCACSGVSAFARTRSRRTRSAMRHQRLERLPDLLLARLRVPGARLLQHRLLERQLPDVHVPGEAVDRDDVALVHGRAVGREGPLRLRELDRVGAAHRGDALAACDDGCVRVGPAGAREDALRRDHAVIVVRRRLAADQDHALACFPSRSASSAVKTTLPIAAPGDAFSPFAIGVAPSALTRRLNNSSSRFASTRSRGVIRVDQSLREHVERHHPLGERRPLSHAHLEDPELALLDRELDVAHVAVVLLERVHVLTQLRYASGPASRARRAAACCGSRPRRPRPGRWRGSRRRAPSPPSRGHA